MAPPSSRPCPSLDGNTFPEPHPILPSTKMMSPSRSTSLPPCCPEGIIRGLRNCQITHQKYGPVTAVAWWYEDQDEPIFLVTNFISMSKACDYYAMRFTIETFFSDQKSRGFNIHKSHLSCPQRLSRLLYASCLAYLWIIFFGYLSNGDRFAQTNP